MIRAKAPAPRMATRLIDEVFDALDEQTVVVPGTGTLDLVIPSLARSLAAVHEQRRAQGADRSRVHDHLPLGAIPAGAGSSTPNCASVSISGNRPRGCGEQENSTSNAR